MHYCQKIECTQTILILNLDLAYSYQRRQKVLTKGWIIFQTLVNFRGITKKYEASFITNKKHSFKQRAKNSLKKNKNIFFQKSEIPLSQNEMFFLCTLRNCRGKGLFPSFYKAINPYRPRFDSVQCNAI